MAGHRIADQALSRDKRTPRAWRMSLCRRNAPASTSLGMSGKFLRSDGSCRRQQPLAPVASVVSSCRQTGTYDRQVVIPALQRHDSGAEQGVVCSETVVTSNFALW